MCTHTLVLDLPTLLIVLQTHCSLQASIVKSFNAVNLLLVSILGSVSSTFRSLKLVIGRAGQNAALNGSAAHSW